MDLSDIKCSYQQDDEYYLTPVSNNFGLFIESLNIKILML